jgi:exopolysaccharide biosynthesis polyprenyl glycosylphosphotransferase
MAVFLAFEASYAIRKSLPLTRNFEIPPPVQWMLVGSAIVMWVALGYWLEVYDRLETQGASEVARDLSRQVFVGGVGLVILEYLARLDLSRAFLGLLLAISTGIIALVRWNAGPIIRRLRREFGAAHYVVIVGEGSPAEQIRAELDRASAPGLRMIGIIAPSEVMQRLPELLQRHVIDEVIVAAGSEEVSSLEPMFLFCDEEGLRTRIALNFFPHVHSEMFLDRLGNVPVLTFSATPHDEIRLLIKRLVDVVFAAVAMVVLAPFMVLVAAIIRVTSRGPAIFRQTRCGLNGRPFTFYKFRSMVDNAEELRRSVEHLNEKSTAFKIREDPRLTPVGRILRKFSIDEWPQFWNVLKGDMSLVGPRPAVPEEVERYERWQRRRLRMRPGLTCLWVLNGRDQLDFETWMKMDMEYIDSWSLTLDLQILVRTVPRVILGKGAN